MKIVQVVPLISDDGAFGGPLRVALNQVAELRARGHDVELVAGWRGGRPPPSEVDGVVVRAFRVHQAVPRAGFSSLISPALWRHLANDLRHADVVHVHSGRDLISLGALACARRAGVPTVVQTHGMIGIDRRPIARVLDALLVRRLVGGAARHLVLTEAEEIELRAALPSATLRPVRIPNGVALPPMPTREPSETVDVLYCARLHERKRPVAFVEAAAMVHGLSTRFSIVGPDEGQLRDVLQAIVANGLEGKVVYEGALPYDKVLARMASADIYVLPSVNEPFGMSLLEAMSLGLATVSVESCGIAQSIVAANAGVVTDGTPAAIAGAINTLSSDPDLRRRLGQSARELTVRVFSIGAVVDALAAIYVEHSVLPGGK